MTTIITPSLELAPVGNEAPPSTLLFSLVDDMGTGESLEDEAVRTHAKVTFALGRGGQRLICSATKFLRYHLERGVHAITSRALHDT
jgi:hypothetical protein